MADRYPISRDAMPVVTLQLRGMGEVVQHATALHAQEISGVAERAVKEAIEGFDWRAQIAAKVREGIEREVTAALQRFLWSGEGKSLIDGVISRAMIAAFGGPLDG